MYKKDLAKALREIEIEAREVAAAYLAVAQASGITIQPYGTKLALIVGKLAKALEDDLLREEVK